MSIYGKIQELCNENNPRITVAELERILNLSNGSIRRWDKSSPRSESLGKVADYFGVSTDYLLGRSDVKEKADELESLAAHKTGEDWTDEERAIIEDFIEFTLGRRKDNGE